SYRRTVELQNKEAAPSEELALQLNVMCELSNRILSTGSPRIVEATDAGGQSLVGKQTNNWWYNPMDYGLEMRALSLPLQVPAKRGGRLKDLKCVLPVEVMLRRRDLLTVADLSAAKGRTFQGENGIRLTIQSVQLQQVGPGWVHLTVTG